MRQRLSASWLLMLCFLLGVQHCAFADNRSPSYPLVTGDGFRHACTFVYDETDRSFSPLKVGEGDSIFVKIDYIEEFFRQIHPLIPNPYVLVTHNGDYPAPGTCRRMLEDKKLLAWFAQNTEGYTHEKLIPIPIGLENRYNFHGNPNMTLQAMESFGKSDKVALLYMNFAIWTCSRERSQVFQLFEQAPYCVTACGRDRATGFLKDLAQSKFVLCPRGNGLDTHRAWETLYMGSIPIVKSSAMDAVFDELPVIIVQDWSEINEEFLLQKYDTMSKGSYNLEKLYMPYWIGRIQRYKKKIYS